VLTSCPSPDHIYSPSRAATFDSHCGHWMRLHRSYWDAQYLIYRISFIVFYFFIFFIVEYLWVFKQEFAACLPTVCNPENFSWICPCHSSFVVVFVVVVVGGCKPPPVYTHTHIHTPRHNKQSYFCLHGAAGKKYTEYTHTHRHR